MKFCYWFQTLSQTQSELAKNFGGVIKYIIYVSRGMIRQKTKVVIVSFVESLSEPDQKTCTFVEKILLGLIKLYYTCPSGHFKRFWKKKCYVKTSADLTKIFRIFIKIFLQGCQNDIPSVLSNFLTEFFVKSLCKCSSFPDLERYFSVIERKNFGRFDKIPSTKGG